MKKRANAITLAIGDGANDVSMIQVGKRSGHAARTMFLIKARSFAAVQVAFVMCAGPCTS